MTSPAPTLRPGLGGGNGSISADCPDSAADFCRVGFDFEAEAVELLNRAEMTCGNVKELAFRLGVAPKTVHDWLSRPRRLPAKYEHRLLVIVGGRDPFLGRLVGALGYRLLPLEPSPEQVAALLVDAGAVAPKKREATVAILRGMRRDGRQARLWETT